MSLQEGNKHLESSFTIATQRFKNKSFERASNIREEKRKASGRVLSHASILRDHKMNQQQLFTALIQMMELYPDIVDWRDDGNSFFIKNYKSFVTRVLPFVFNHSNFITFWRLLIQKHHFHQQRCLNGKLILEFSHPAFVRDSGDFARLQLNSVSVVSNSSALKSFKTLKRILHCSKKKSIR